MKKDTVTRTLVKHTIRKTIREIAADPERKLRAVAELASENASGKTQKDLFDAVRGMLDNDSSAYYAFGKDLVASVDEETLSVFGFNVGYNGCTSGAKTVRAKEDELGCRIPWCFALHVGEGACSAGAADHIIGEGRKLGVYVYLISGTPDRDFLPLLKKYDDCAFVLFFPAERVTDALADELAQYRNVMTAVSSPDRAVLSAACARLRKRRMLYSVYGVYGPGSADGETLLNPDVMAFCESLHPAFYLLAPNRAEKHYLHDRAVEFRTSQQYALLLMDLGSDLLAASRAVSGEECFDVFFSGNQLLTERGEFKGDAYDAGKKPLADVLKAASLH